MHFQGQFVVSSLNCNEHNLKTVLTRHRTKATKYPGLPELQTYTVKIELYHGKFTPGQNIGENCNIEPINKLNYKISEFGFFLEIAHSSLSDFLDSLGNDI